MAKKRKKPRDVKKDIRQHTEAICRGTMLCIDPASGGSSQPGYAVYVKGELKECGVLELTKSKPLDYRLRQLLKDVESFTDIDLLVLERIGNSRTTHASLLKAVGVVLAGHQAPAFIEISPMTWRKYVDLDTYEKSDINDAVSLGACALRICEGE